MPEQLDLTGLNGEEIDRVPAAVREGDGLDNERTPRGEIQKMDNLRNGARNDEPRPESIAADAVPPTGF